MEFPTTRPTKGIDLYLEEERRRAIVETLVWVCGKIPDVGDDFFDDIPKDIHSALCDELEAQQN